MYRAIQYISISITHIICRHGESCNPANVLLKLTVGNQNRRLHVKPHD